MPVGGIVVWVGMKPLWLATTRKRIWRVRAPRTSPDPDWVPAEMCSERDSPLEPFVLPAPGQPELARLTCGAHLGPPVLTRKQKRPRVNSLVCDRAAVFCAAGPPEALSWMSRLVTQAAKRERELARAHSQRLKQATLSLPGESVSRGFADRGALEGYPSHYTSLVPGHQQQPGDAIPRSRLGARSSAAKWCHAPNPDRASGHHEAARWCHAPDPNSAPGHQQVWYCLREGFCDGKFQTYRLRGTQ